jgi:hypothetical protein
MASPSSWLHQQTPRNAVQVHKPLLNCHMPIAARWMSCMLLLSAGTALDRVAHSHH